jgi:predicted nucleic acid-binding protein
MIVIDASAMLEILSHTELGLAMEASFFEEDLHAPHTIDLEVLQTLRRWTRAGIISTDEADQAIKLFLSFAITRHPHLHLIPAIWSLRHNLTAYEAAYLALARLLGARLLSADGALQKMAARYQSN